MRWIGAIAGVALGTIGTVAALELLFEDTPRPMAALSPSSSEAERFVDDTVLRPDGGVAQRSQAARPTRARLTARPRTVLSRLVAPDEWPLEPSAPTTVDEKRFVEALVSLCGPHADAATRPWYGPWILRAARAHRADPFMLAAVFFHETECTSHEGTTDLFVVDPTPYEASVRRSRYHYVVFSEGSWVRRERALDAFPFSAQFLRNPESALYFAAAFLSTWEEQVVGLRAAFVQPVEYRSYVSHFFWGDQVQSNREEDTVLVTRRRLLQYYGALPKDEAVRWRGFELGCPLDGCPRIVTSTLGDAREGGLRLHAGNDFESNRGEPVRVVADGEVVFAGVDLPGHGAAARIPIWAQKRVDANEMGAGGLYICVDHGHRGREKLVSCYMHLEAAVVAQGRIVRRGEQIGRVGTTGIHQSRPHLHFELHSTEGSHRATDLMHPLALGHPAAHAAQNNAIRRHRLVTDYAREPE